jgi:hypothetical protein
MYNPDGDHGFGFNYFTVTEAPFDLDTYTGRVQSIASSMRLDRAFYTSAGVKHQ